VRGDRGVDEIAGSLDEQLVGWAQIRSAQGPVPGNGGQRVIDRVGSRLLCYEEGVMFMGTAGKGCKGTEFVALQRRRESRKLKTRWRSGVISNSQFHFVDTWAGEQRGDITVASWQNEVFRRLLPVSFFRTS
jgi:hypothetical protein